MDAEQDRSAEDKLNAEGPSPHAGDDPEHRHDANGRNPATRDVGHTGGEEPPSAAASDPQQPDGGPADGAD